MSRYAGRMRYAVQMTDTAGAAARGSNSTADRALMILGMFSDDRATITASEVGSSLAIGRSSAYRYLQSLAAAQFLEAAPGGGFRLGLRILQLARVARRSYGLSAVALPAMKSLSERYQLTVLLTKRVGEAIVCLEREEAPTQQLRLSYERGTLLPINAGASALVMLAALPRSEVLQLVHRAPLRKITGTTVSDLDGLMERLAVVKRNGYCISYGEVDEDMVGIAVPIADPGGDVVAGLSVVGLQSRIPEPLRMELVGALLSAAAAINATNSLTGG